MASEEYQQLLVQLKSTVEGLLIGQVPNVWNICGGLNRLHSAVECIFSHGFKTVNAQDKADLWTFIYAISWLQPTPAASPSYLIEAKPDSSHVPNRISSDKALMWIYRSLETHTLSQQLSWLLSDREHLLSCYHSIAFLCQEKYAEATLICLRAVEQNQSSLITEIDPSLYLAKWNLKDQKSHRRCSSFPEILQRNVLLTKAPSVPDATPELSETAETTEPPAPVECASSTNRNLLKGSNVCVAVNQPQSADKSVTHNQPQEPESVISAQQSDSLTVQPCEVRAAQTGESDVLASNTSESLQSVPLQSENSEEKVKSNSGKFVSRLKAWNSLPSLLKDDQSHGNRSSKTVPTTPVHSSHRHFSYRSSSTLKLSPSALQVDYSSIERSDSSNRKGKQGRSASFSSKSTKSFNSEIAKPVALVEISCAAHRPVERRRKSAEKTVVDVTDNTAQSSTRPIHLTIPDKSWERTQTSQDKNVVSPPRTLSNPVISRSHRESLQQPSKVQSQIEVPQRKSFIEDGGHSVQPMATGYFPRPYQGQSLIAFLSSGQFSRSSAELDRENAHFSISEAIIQAIEQLKCNRAQRLMEEQVDESDEEMSRLKQRLRLRRRQCQEEKRKPLWGVSLLNDGKTDTTTTDQSASPLSSSPRTPTESLCLSSDGVEDVDLDEAQNLNILKDSGFSMSMASLYSEADISKTPISNLESTVAESEPASAAGVALSLIRQFSDKQLPRASDLKWLVSEQDAPLEVSIEWSKTSFPIARHLAEDQKQQVASNCPTHLKASDSLRRPKSTSSIQPIKKKGKLLPMPRSWSTSPENSELAVRQTSELRGNLEWAPPRAQIIFTPHPPPVRRILMARQNYRCAGCGMKVAPEYANRFRYCEYLGRYFCTGCHSNQLALIPGRIISKWDFVRCPVSTFSFKLLDQMSTDPLFPIGRLNPALYRKSRALERCRLLRVQLFFLRDLIFYCRFATETRELLTAKVPQYMLEDVEMYSLLDLEHVKSGTLQAHLRPLIEAASGHVSQCQFCQARGFLCEICKSDQVIFPWQLETVIRCSECGSCYHIRCNPPVPCPHCRRMSKRRSSEPVPYAEVATEVAS